MVEWAKTAKKGLELGNRMGDHFAWLKAKMAGVGSLTTQQIPFAAILASDIELRKQYRCIPFVLNPIIYQSTLDKHVNGLQTNTLLSEVASLHSQLSSMANRSSTSLGSAMSVDQPTAGSSQWWFPLWSRMFPFRHVILRGANG